MSNDTKKITSLSSFRSKKAEKVEIEDDTHPMAPQDTPDMVPGFSDMPPRAQQKVIESFKAAQEYMGYLSDHADEVMKVAKEIREYLDSLENQTSPTLVAALLLNACAGCQFLEIPGPEAAIIFSSIYNQLLTTAQEKPEETTGEDKPN